jgi:hypothetical protein
MAAQMTHPEHRHVLVRAILAVAAAGCVAAGALPAGAAAHSAPVVTPSGVRGIVAAYSAANNHANETESEAVQARDEVGTAATVDDVGFVTSLRAGIRYEGAGAQTYVPFTLAPFESSVPEQSTYPASMLVASHTVTAKGSASSGACGSADQLSVFERTGSSSPWRVGLYAYLNKDFPRFASNSKGFAPPVAAKSLEYAPGTIESAVARALQHYAVTGALAQNLTAQDLSGSKHCWSLGDPRAIQKTEAKQKIDTSFTYLPFSKGDIHLAAVPGHGAVVTFSIKMVTTFQANSPSGFVTFSSTHGDPGSYLLAAGTYVSATFPSVCMVVAADPQRGSTAPPTGSIPRLIGGSCSPLLATGIAYKPAAPPIKAGITFH